MVNIGYDREMDWSAVEEGTGDLDSMAMRAIENSADVYQRYCAVALFLGYCGNLVGEEVH